MKNMISKIFLTAALAMGLVSFNVNAALMGSVDGIWENARGSATVSDLGTNKISWGRSAGSGQSSWEFVGSSNFDVLTNGNWFGIGEFIHVNNPIYDADFRGADLAVGLSIGNADFDLSFFFGHNETLNSGSCPVGGNPCADIVKLPTRAAKELVKIDDMVYEMTIKGFINSTRTGKIVTPEQGSEVATLHASLAKVPEPSVIALFGIGLLGLGFASRRKSNS